MRLQNKVILVTASTRGIGFGLATPVYADLAGKDSRR